MADLSISLHSPAAAAVAFLGNWRKRMRTLAETQGIRAALMRGLTWMAAGSVLAQGGSFLSSILVARILGKDYFGKFAMVQSTAVALTAVAGFGLGVTATKYVSEYRIADPERAGRILGLCAMVAIVAALCFSAVLLAFAHSFAPGNDAAVVSGLRICAIYVFFITLNGYQMGAMAGFEEFREMAIIQAGYGISSLLLTWALALWGGFTGAVIAQQAGALLLFGSYQRLLSRSCQRNRIRIRYRGFWKERAVLLQFSIPSATSGMLATVAMWWCNIDLARAAGYGELALFTAINNLRSMVLFVPGLISRVTTPCLNRLLASRQVSEYRQTFYETLLANGGISLVLAAVLSITGPALLRLFGRDFLSPPLLLILFLGSVVFEVLATTLFQSLFTAGKIWHNVAVVTIWTVVVASCAGTTASRFGAEGLAFAYFCGWAVSLALYTAATRKHWSDLEVWQ